MSTLNLSKTYKKIAYSPDTNEWTFCNRAPNHSRYCYGLSTMFFDIVRPGSRFYMKFDMQSVTILQGAELLLKKMRAEKSKMAKDLKSLLADPVNYKGTYEYCPQRGLAEMPEQIQKRTETIDTWAKLVKDIKKSPDYLIHVLKA